MPNTQAAAISGMDTEQRIATIRSFNRFYTRQIGVLNEDFLHSPYSLAEGRVLYEVAHHNAHVASAIGKELGLDGGYLSRILRKLEKNSLIKRSRSNTDGRSSNIELTAKGREACELLNDRARAEVGETLKRLPATDQSRLIAAMGTIQSLLDEAPKPAVPYLLRSHQPGDMGWIVHRQGVLYAQEYNYDEAFEAMVAEIVADFIQNLDTKRERCWIAEKDGEIVGSIFLVKKSNSVAKLRLLYVEPSARGLGIGARLIAECVRFARQAGYKEITLWTQNDLDAARHLYEKAGFRVIEKKPHHSFGRDLVAETWKLKL